MRRCCGGPTRLRVHCIPPLPFVGSGLCEFIQKERFGITSQNFFRCPIATFGDPLSIQRLCNVPSTFASPQHHFPQSFLSCRSEQTPKLERDEKFPHERERMIPGQVPSFQLSVSSAGTRKSARAVWVPFMVDGEKEELPQCDSAQLGEMNGALEGAIPLYRP